MDVPVVFTKVVRSSIRCLSLSVDQVDRFSKRPLVAEIDGTGIGWERDALKWIRQQATIVSVPSASGLICLLCIWV